MTYDLLQSDKLRKALDNRLEPTADCANRTATRCSARPASRPVGWSKPAAAW